MTELKANLKGWLSESISDSLFVEYISSNKSSLLSEISRGQYLKLKHLNRGSARDLLNTLEPCKVCSTPFEDISELWGLDKNKSYVRIKKPSYVEEVSNTYGPYDMISYWQCTQCGSITEFITQEKANYGKWGKVG